MCGRTAQAVAEAQLARGVRYHAGLLNLAAMKGCSEDELISTAPRWQRCCRTSASTCTAVGGLALSAAFWTRCAAIENVVAIKVALFNRHYALDVVRGVAKAGAAERVVLYTGNDDQGRRSRWQRGGLLGGPLLRILGRQQTWSDSP